MSIAQVTKVQKPLTDLSELLYNMGLTLRYSVHPIGDEEGQAWEIKVKNHAVDWGLGVGTNRTDALADLLLSLGIQLTVDDPDNPLARWGRPYRGYDDRVALEHIGWANVSEIRGWRHV